MSVVWKNGGACIIQQTSCMKRPAKPEFFDINLFLYTPAFGCILFFSIVWLLLTPVSTFARQADTTFVTRSIAFTRQAALASLKTEWPINTGSQYVEYASIEGEHPYLIPTWSSGSVNYLGDIFNNVSMLLDLRGDRLIIQHPLYNQQIELSPQKVSAFTFQGHVFINIHRDSVSNLPASGYYEVLQNGPVSLLARRQKTIQRSIASRKVVAIVKEVTRYYVMKDRRVLPVSSRKSILSALADRSDLKSELKKNKIRFGSKKERGLSETVRIYNQLITLR